MPIDDADIEALVQSGTFDPVLYSLAERVKGSPRELIEHHLARDERTRVVPGIVFEPAFYLRAYPDVAASRLNPFAHFAEHGRREGRLPTAAAERLSSLEAAIAALGKRIDALGHQVAALGAGNAQATPPAKRRLALKRPPTPQALATLARAAAVLKNPGAVLRELREVGEAAKVTSYRTRRSSDGWRSVLDRRLVREAVRRHLVRKLRHAKPVLYEVRQRLPTVETPRPRIMHVIPNVWMGGSTQLILDLFDHLGHAFEMHVMTSSFPPNGEHRGMIIHDLSEPTSVEAVKTLFEKFQPHLIHVHYWGDVDLPWYKKAFEAAAALRIPILQNINTPVQPYKDANVAAIAYVSNYVREMFGGDVADVRNYIVHPGIDLDRFGAVTEMTKDALDSIGMVYRLEGDKLNISAIDLFIEVVKRRPATRVFIIGGGTFFQPYLERTIQEGVRDNFVFTGYVPYEDLPFYYSQFGTFVAPVWKESFGQVTPFAMNMGRAVAGYDVGALSEILESSDTLGRDLDDAAGRIVALLDAPDRIVALGARNREIAQRQYSIEKMCAHYRAIYAELLGTVAADLMPGYPEATLFHA